jgi:hypothetical protein
LVLQPPAGRPAASAAQRALTRRYSAPSRPQDALAAASKALNELRAQHAAERRAAAEALAQLRSTCAGLEGRLVGPQAGPSQPAHNPLPGAVAANSGEVRMSRRRRLDDAAASPQGQAAACPAAPEPLALALLDLPDPLLLKILAVHPEACFDCAEIKCRRLRRVSLEAAGALAGQRWALRLAAQRGHVAALRALLDGGADIEAELDGSRMRALHVAALYGRTAAVRLLLERGADVKAGDILRFTALQWGAVGGSVAVVQLLLDAGSDINAVCTSQRAALHWAAVTGRTGVVELLVASGADVHLRDRWGTTALREAAARGHTAALRVLLAAGADVHAANIDGATPLAAARDGGHAGAAQALVEAGATH